MDRSLAQRESIVRNRICGVCPERAADGKCALERASGCALFQLFPQVAQAIDSVKSVDIHHYIEAIRKNVCSVCLEQDSDGSCQERQQVRCALDAYLLLVVEAVGEATGTTFDRQTFGFCEEAGTWVRPEFQL